MDFVYTSMTEYVQNLALDPGESHLPSPLTFDLSVPLASLPKLNCTTLFPSSSINIPVPSYKIIQWMDKQKTLVCKKCSGNTLCINEIKK